MKYPSIAVGVLVVLLCWATALHGQTPLQVAADSTQVVQGESLWVHVVAGSVSDTLTDLFGMGFQLHYDPAAFRVEGGVKGAFWGAETVLEFALVDSVAGFAAYSVTLTSPPGLTGHGTIASFHVHARPESPLGEQTLLLADLDAIDSNGQNVAFAIVPDTVEVTSSAVVFVPGSEGIPSGRSMIFAHPNPARMGEARIFYRLLSTGPARISVFTTAGRLARVLSAEDRAAETGTLFWDGRDENGREAPPGVYLLRLETARGFETGRMILIR
ncbi:MAG: hypothetical protein ABIK65_12685 [Candidatus Eisenbacteria bacterium]